MKVCLRSLGTTDDKCTINKGHSKQLQLGQIYYTIKREELDTENKIEICFTIQTI